MGFKFKDEGEGEGERVTSGLPGLITWLTCVLSGIDLSNIGAGLLFLWCGLG